ncbi:hypothetical protein [Microbulbifer sp. YPW16]|uniref:hypothetical protein n=1 Tax=Microbulbifer sp. YPW16 TaxID=2904242 RepID=UPI001E2CBC94|nr:hypothetical protein [Microbulbifer sp. YPW16]UHQ55865.1 hypothetical protein LVE68_02425 [Microbulbifer sp. YPW16]
MISLTKNTAALFSNRRKVCREFVAVAPVRFFIDVVVGFVKSILELFVFILPIKIVLIIAAPEMPVMFDKVLPGFSRPEWAGILTGLIVVLHIVVLMADWYLKRSAERYTEKFAIQHKKGRFADSDFLTSVYTGIVDARGGSLLLVALSGVIGLVYTQFLLFFVVAVSLSALGVIALASVSKHFAESFLARPPAVLGKISNLVFISCFCYLVYAFILSEQPPEFLQAIVSIILSRRLLTALSQKVGNLVWFKKKKAAIQKLFYRGHAALSQGAGGSRAFIDSVSRESLPAFVARVMDSLGMDSGQLQGCEWVESPLPWMSLVQCSLPSTEVAAADEILVLKVYESNKARTAKNELELYPELESQGIIPSFIGIAELDGHQVHAFKLSNDWAFARDQDAIIGLRRRLLPLTFDQALVEEYCSVHPTLMDRLNLSLLSRLYLMADSDEKELLDSFLEALPAISERVRALPLKLLPPDPVLKQLAVSNGEAVSLLGLGDWKLEPVGFSLWPSDSPEEMAERLISSGAVAEGLDVGGVVSHIRLCTLFAELERHCRSGRLREGLKVVGRIIEMHESQMAEEQGIAETA